MVWLRRCQALLVYLRASLGVYAVMLDALFELVGRFIAGVLIDFLFYGVCYPIGWLTLKILTLGRYPPPPPANRNLELVAAFPLIVAIVGITAAFS